jgi:hypothetical protein
MQLNFDVHPSTRPSAGSAEPSDGWVLGLAAEDSQPAMSRTPLYSFLADCECPDDCLRDHENE